jgi:hypothetical protein
VHVTTAEGDPVIEYYRSLPDLAGLELWTDSRQDEFAAYGWTYSRCPEARSLHELGECEHEDFGEP